MKQYHKIQSVFKRDPENRFKTFLDGQFSLPEFEFLKDNSWVYTEKIDGTNIRVIYDPEAVSGNTIAFGGKTDNAQMPAPLLNRLNELFLPKADLFKNEFGDTAVCLYGEGYGAKIQKAGGNYNPAGQDFVLFDVRIGRWWLERSGVEEIAAKLGIDVVPIIGEGTVAEMIDFVRGGFDSQWGPFAAEGVVARPKVELTARSGSRIITKLKHIDFPEA